MSIGGLDRVGEALEAAVVAPGLGQLEQPPLGILDLLLRRHVDRRVIGDVDHVLADGDQRAAGRQVVDGAAVVGGVDDGDGLRRQPGEIVRDRHVADLLVGRQEGLDRHRIGDLAHADQFAGDLEDLAVQRLVEMRRLQEIRDAVEGVVVDEDRRRAAPARPRCCSAPRGRAASPPRRICALHFLPSSPRSVPFRASRKGKRRVNTTTLPALVAAIPTSQERSVNKDSQTTESVCSLLRPRPTA